MPFHSPCALHTMVLVGLCLTSAVTLSWSDRETVRSLSACYILHLKNYILVSKHCADENCFHTKLIKKYDLINVAFLKLAVFAATN